MVATAEPSWYGEVEFVIWTLNASDHRALAQSFVDFIMGDEGQRILQEHGFLTTAFE